MLDQNHHRKSVTGNFLFVSPDILLGMANANLRSIEEIGATLYIDCPAGRIVGHGRPCLGDIAIAEGVEQITIAYGDFGQ